MPELPDVLLYLETLRPRVQGKVLTRLRLVSPFVLRTVEPGVEELEGKKVVELRRWGKRVVFCFEGNLFVVVHLMIAGRFRWSEKVGAKPVGKVGLASFEFENGTLQLVEASKEKRAGIWVVRGWGSVEALGPRGLEVMSATLAQFATVLRAENHTLKRSLTDPRLIDGIGNAYSDEILHAAGLSPVMLTSRLTDEQIDRLFFHTRAVLAKWTRVLQEEFSTKFPGPGDVTAFRPDFAVHGKYGEPCPVCGTAVQRIRYAENETDYCPRCQTEGKVLADRSLSRLLKDDWPSRIEELEAGKRRSV